MSKAYYLLLLIFISSVNLSAQVRVEAMTTFAVIADPQYKDEPIKYNRAYNDTPKKLKDCFRGPAASYCFMARSCCLFTFIFNSNTSFC